MSTFLLDLIGKWLSIIFVSFLSLFQLGNSQEMKKYSIENQNLNKDTSVYSKIIPYTTTTRYDATIDSKIERITTKGENGLVYNTDGENVVIRKMKPQVITKGLKVNEPIKKQKITEEKSVLVGKMTGYGPDCVGCSGRGNVACRTRTGSKFSLKTNGIYYKDQEYGNVRVLAAPKHFPCGTIMKVTKGNKTYYGVVLDYGGSMTSAWEKGDVWFDLAYLKNGDSGKDGLVGNNIQFEIKRWGWN